MIAARVEPGNWMLRRWLLVVVLIAVLQTGLIFWLGARTPGRGRRTNSGPRVYLPADQRSELAEGSNPTLFVLANRHGFSGPAWLAVPPLQNPLPDWSEPARPLARPIREFGETLRRFVANNLSTPLEVAPKTEPQLDAVELYLVPDLTPAQSSLTLDGQLADRPLFSKFKLKSWPAGDILTNSVVLAGVDKNGRVFSAVLLAKSGSKDADESALSLAKSAHFQPLRRSNPAGPGASPSALGWGRLIFHWQTVPLPATNGAAAVH
jgi:hypothetical protein